MILSELKDFPGKIVKCFWEIDTYIKSKENIVTKENKTMISYCVYSIRKGNSVVWVEPHDSNIKIHLCRPNKYSDRFHKIKPIGWGKYPEIEFKEEELGMYFSYIKELIDVAYKNKKIEISGW